MTSTQASSFMKNVNTNMERFIKSQLHTKLPIPTHDFSNQVVIVTGASSGLGLEAARYFVKLNAAKVIITARSEANANKAKEDIETSTGRTGIIEVYELDLTSYDSVKAFAASVEKEERIDILLSNAGMLVTDFELAGGFESTITVNVVSTFLLAILLLPVLRKTAEKHSILPVVTVVSSGTHSWVQLPEWKEDDIFAALNRKEGINMEERYSVSKLILLLVARQMAHELRSEPKVVVNTVLPGLCRSSLTRNITNEEIKTQVKERMDKLARTSEAGSRCYLHAVTAGWESNGRLLNDCEIQDEAMSPLVLSEDGPAMQKKIWDQLLVKFEEIQPGVKTLL